MNQYDRFCLLQFSFQKATRATISRFAGETIAFADSFDKELTLQHVLQRVLGRKTSVFMFTDSKHLFDVILRNQHTAERRLMLNIAAVRESYNDGILTNVSFIKREYNTADTLAKITQNIYLNHLLTTGTICHPDEQYFVKNFIALSA